MGDVIPNVILSRKPGEFFFRKNSSSPESTRSICVIVILWSTPHSAVSKENNQGKQSQKNLRCDTREIRAPRPYFKKYGNTGCKTTKNPYLRGGNTPIRALTPTVFLKNTPAVPSDRRMLQ